MKSYVLYKQHVYTVISNGSNMYLKMYTDAESAGNLNGKYIMIIICSYIWTSELFIAPAEVTVFCTALECNLQLLLNNCLNLHSNSLLFISINGQLKAGSHM